MNQPNYGLVNGHNIGLIMREMVRRAMTEIAKQRFIFEAYEKKSHKQDDRVTTADRGAQGIYVELTKKNFPTFGMIGEEDKLRVKPRKPTPDLWFAFDPLDGTKAFIRRQSHGIGTMISLVNNEEVLAAYVGDVMTEEIFGYHPNSDKVYRISEFEHPEELRSSYSGDIGLRGKAVLLRDLPDNYSPLVQRMARPRQKNGLFRKVGVVEGGSMSLTVARLWKGEVGAVIIPPGPEMLWDRAPIIGISQKLGFVFLGIEGNKIFEWKPNISLLVFERRFELMIVHRDHVGEVYNWLEKKRQKIKKKAR